MREIKFTCDCCGREFANDHELLTIGSRDEHTLQAKNNLKEARMFEMHSHSPIHFCTKDCLVNYFFNPSNTGG